MPSLVCAHLSLSAVDDALVLHRFKNVNRRWTQINADDFSDLQSGKDQAFTCKEETHVIIGCAFEVLNELGHGLNEKLYENSLVVEFKRRGIAFDQQRRFDVLR
jgi:hypothetical protein